MTGPEHYREAERLIEEANHAGHSDPQRGDGIVAAAQVHAILALADALALPPVLDDRRAWRDAAHEQVPEG